MIAPKLRFSEFDSAWKNVTLGFLSKLVTSGSRDWAQYYSEMGSKFIRMTNLSRDRIDLLLDDMRYVDVSSNSADGRRTSLIPGDILMSITAELGKIGVIPDGFGEAYINQHTALIRLNEGVNPRFIAQLLGTKHQNKKINKLNDAGAKAGLNLPTIKSLEITIPEAGEQKKIATFLSLVDQKISLLTKKHKILIQYKKGVMQKIFTQEIRFKGRGGKDYPGWVPLTLGDVSIVNMGQSPDSSSYNEESIGMPLIQGNADISNRLTVPRVWTSQPTKICNVGDLIFTVRAPVGAIAKSNVKACIGRGVCSIVPRANSNQDFLYQLLFWFESFRWKSIEQGSTFTAVSGGDIRSLKVDIPCFEEQEKIASILGLLDHKVDSINSELELIKQFKQGLLQQMFVQ